MKDIAQPTKFVVKVYDPKKNTNTLINEIIFYCEDLLREDSPEGVPIKDLKITILTGEAGIIILSNGKMERINLNNNNFDRLDFKYMEQFDDRLLSATDDSLSLIYPVSSFYMDVYMAGRYLVRFIPITSK